MPPIPKIETANPHPVTAGEKGVKFEEKRGKKSHQEEEEEGSPTSNLTNYTKNGIGTVADSELALTIPLEIMSSTRSIEVTSGAAHSLLAFKSNMVYSFGLNQSGQLGIRRISEPKDTPQPVIPLGDFRSIKNISCGREHSAILLNENGKAKLYMFGNSMYGQLGLGYDKLHPRVSTERFVTMATPSLLNLPNNEIPFRVECGMDHTAVLTELGNVYTMGWGADGQLGNGQTKDSPIPVLVQGFHGIKMKKISTKMDFTLALAEDNSVYSWGNSEYGQTGHSKEKTQITEAKRIEFEFSDQKEHVLDITAGGTFSHFLTNLGQVYACGFGLGLGCLNPNLNTADLNSYYRLKPVRVDFPENPRIVKMFSGPDYSFAVTDKNEIYSWGWNRYGQLGSSNLLNQLNPTKIHLTNNMSDSSFIDSIHTIVCAHQYVFCVAQTKE